ncbi:tripartite tricarboxylate transporter TctB family protein [Rhizobium sp. L1K21]|uniref:tripartite tricarboxylate transporter TctB family protein n=1 Tax=Rhizobium sp. L1K21 TaxID=2954933 RepID=UPI002093F737|nr:tripartite tricarboxylate transporter TctB family protein [Rhizobium sp. L1K21]MCO6187904.1 tripartite tricarboxylate transporter TctB family protein [Rhizobium sp. L1K21]
MSYQEDDHPHVFPESRKPGEMLFVTITMFVAVALLALAPWQTTWLPGKGFAAQPRFWPMLSLGGVVLFGLLNALSRMRITRTPGRWQEATVWMRSLEFVGWYMLYVAAIPLLGYLIATVLFTTGMALRLGYRGRSVMVAGLFGVFVVLFFKTAMNVKIPGGAIYEFAPDTFRYFLLRYF